MTREEVKKELNCIADEMPSMECRDWKEAICMAIKALEQKSVLDKIKAEIEALPKTYPFVDHIDMYVKEDDVRKIIDKYKAESEDKE